MKAKRFPDNKIAAVADLPIPNRDIVLAKRTLFCGPITRPRDRVPTQHLMAVVR